MIDWGDGSRCNDQQQAFTWMESFAAYFSQTSCLNAEASAGRLSHHHAAERRRRRAPDGQITHAGRGIGRRWLRSDSHSVPGSDDGQPLLGAVNLANPGPGGNWVNPLFGHFAHFATCVQCLQRGLTQFSDTHDGSGPRRSASSHEERSGLISQTLDQYRAIGARIGRLQPVQTFRRRTTGVPPPYTGPTTQ